jgi:hypothetical protein
MGTVAALSSSMCHDLREGLAMGAEEYVRRLGMAERSPDLPPGMSCDDIWHLAPATASGSTSSDSPGGDEVTVVRLLDAMLLSAIARPAPGTDTGSSVGADPDAGVVVSGATEAQR